MHYFHINEMDNPSSRRSGYVHYMRRFWHWERNEAHLETYVRKNFKEQPFAIRLHTGNEGSETPWDGHLIFLWFGIFWGHTFFRKWASWISRCTGYKYDTREWAIRITDKSLSWSIAEHSDMCDHYRMHSRSKGRKVRNTPRWRRGYISISPAEWIWGPKRYSYETVDSFATILKFEEGDYPVIIDLRKSYLGRTKVPRSKHVQSWTLEVDAPNGIPTHPDRSGGWKGDRTYGFGVDFTPVDVDDWRFDAENAVGAWVRKERARTGFRRADPLEEAV